MDPVAAAPAPAAPVEEPSEGALMDKAVAGIKARDDKPAEPDKPEAKPAEKPKKPARSADIAALADREYKAVQTEKKAKEILSKYQVDEELLGRKDLKGFLEHVAKRHGFTFADFVEVMSQDKEPDKSAAEIAKETAEKTLAEAREAEKKEREAAAAKDVDEKLAKRKADWLAMAEADGDRWELLGMNPVVGRSDDGRPLTAIDAVWEVVEGHWLEQVKAGKQPTAMPIDQALDAVEAKLRERRDARKKPGSATTSAGGNGRNEAASRENGRAAEPSFTQRNTSGVPGAVGDRKDVDIADLPDHEAIRVAAARARIAL